MSIVPPPRQFSLSAKSLAGLGLQPNPKTDRDDFWTCFWNVENLFAPETATKLARGPLTKDECTAKLRRIAQVLNQAAAGDAPDLIALAEVQSERLLGELEKLLSQRYHQLFQDPHEANVHTGKPVARDVAALLAGIIIDDMRLFKELSAANAAVFGAGVKVADLPNANVELFRRFDNALDAHDPEPEHFVDGPDGRLVRHYSRQDETGQWRFVEVLTVPGRRHHEPVQPAIKV